MKPLIDSFKHWGLVLQWALAVCRTALKMLRIKPVKTDDSFLWETPALARGSANVYMKNDFSLEQRRNSVLPSLWWWKVKMAVVGKRICDCQEAVREQYYGWSWLVSVYSLCECIYVSVKLEPRIGCGVSPAGWVRELALHSVRIRLPDFAALWGVGHVIPPSGLQFLHLINGDNVVTAS